jgi:hypothetical protein
MRTFTVLTTLFSAFVLTAPLAAQEAPPGGLSEQQLSVYTSTYVALAAAGDAYQRQLGLTHDVIERDRLWVELAEARESVLSEHEISVEEYEHMTALVSVDEGLRARFEALLEELSVTGIS